MRTVTADWLKQLPWPKIASAALISVAGVIGGTLHLESDSATKREATVGQNVQIEEFLRHNGEDCALIASSEDRSVQVRRCDSDQCRFIRVQGDGTIFAYYLISGSRIPAAPTVETATDGLFGDLTLSSAAHAQGRCLTPEQHGAPDHMMPVEYGPVDGNGWQQVVLRWAHGCTLLRHFHRPSGSWSSEYKWITCAGH